MQTQTVIAEREKRAGFGTGLQAGFSLAVGYLPIAIAYGLLARSTGLSLWETTAMSLMVFAGASQYIALNLLALGTGGLEIILTTFMVNFRHLLMSAALSHRVEKEHPLIKALYAFGVTDETFAVAAVREGEITTAFLCGLNLLAYSSWVLGSVLGFGAGDVLPPVLQDSMGIALYAMFIGLLVPPLKKSRKVAVLAVTAALLNTLLSMFLSAGWAIALSAVIAAAGVEMVMKGEREDA